MRTVAFYISNHGFGHASRNIPIINHMLIKDRDLRIIIKTHSEQLDFLMSSLRSISSRIDSIEFFDAKVDIGLICKPGSISLDVYKLRNQIHEFIASWDQLINEEASFLIQHNINLVVSDIVPWVFKCAELCRIRSVFISNFTWVEIYQDILDPFIAEKYQQYYNLADEALIYPLAGKIECYFKSFREIGFSCRKFDTENIKDIQAKLNSPLVYFSVGRSIYLDQIIDVSKLPYRFIVTEGTNLHGKNVLKLPSDTLITHDYIAASDYIVTKAGWSTIAESICAQKPMLVLRREEVAEDRNTLAKLLELGIALPIDIKHIDENNLLKSLEALEKKRENYGLLSNRYSDCSKMIANQILEFLYERS